ncbi:ABC transporter related protein [Kribbella flavida DSM 17836]|uniref:Nickel import system ATP-binding protein NikD n=1 Tax=Kribbella flavida (strain DSM 17836 / JCM 10339 / NBRC 14399) TaxID=479435 RepID=D2PR81_KRIFD|nr:ATP-binding cassette domain-containing protein [Kribbella flavida]ADB33029.1 ABC transporter related protein [Kribbella flavida DSM 17836]
MKPLLTIEELRVSFVQYDRGLRRREIVALAGMDLTADRGQVVALVGASGAGKTLLAHAVLGMLPPNATQSGRIAYAGAPVDATARRRLAGREIVLLPQSVDYLDPLATIGRQVRRSAHLAGHADPRRVAATALAQRGLGDEVLKRYPHELSGGMTRRVLVTMATMGDPQLILADEPTPGLPPAEVATVLREFRALADDGRAVVLITHELGGALEIADVVVICHDGRTIETVEPSAFTADEGRRLRHPYTRTLWQALPANGFHVPEEDRC